MKIAVLIDFPLSHGIWSGITTEGRTMLNLAWMLADQGEEVDLVSLHVVRGRAAPAGLAGSLSIRHLSELPANPLYDVSILPNPTVKDYLPARQHFWPLWDLRHSDLDTMLAAQGDGIKLCLLYPELRERDRFVQDPLMHWAGKEDRWNTFRKDIARLKLFDLPLPIPVLRRSTGYESDLIVWSTRHLPDDSKYLVVNGTFYETLAALGKHRTQYRLEVLMGRQPDMADVLVTSFPGGAWRGNLPYNDLLDTIGRAKLSAGAYYVGSFLEAAAAGAVPMIWDHIKGGITFVEKARELGCLFSITDHTCDLRYKVDRLLTDRGFYDSVQAGFSALAAPHAFDNSYRSFKRIVES